MIAIISIGCLYPTCDCEYSRIARIKGYDAENDENYIFFYCRGCGARFWARYSEFPGFVKDRDPYIIRTKDVQKAFTEWLSENTSRRSSCIVKPTEVHQ